jgi:hypothetical protein
VLAVSDPREGLPPCTSLVIFEDRMVALIDQEVCQHDWGDGRFRLHRGITNGSREPHPGHPELFMPGAASVGRVQATDDPDEAQAAFDKGAEWVRTGEMA